MVPIGLPMLMRACSTRIWQPVAPYACKVHRLVVNGQAVPLSRPCVAVIDTGTTGLVISDSLYNSDELPLPGAAMRHVGVEGKPRRAAIAPRARHPYSLSACPPPRVAVLTERGRVVRFGAARKPKAQPAALTSTASAGGGAPRGSAGTAEPFPLIVTPVPLPWFEPEVDTFYQRGKGKVGGGGGGGRETDPGHGGRRERGEREGSSRGSRGRTKRHHPPAAKTIWSPIFTRMEPRPRRICPTQFEDVDDRNGRKTTTTSTAKRMMWRQSFARSNAAAPSKSAMLSSCRRGASRGGG